MYKSKGIGLAANQVGSLERLMTIDVSEERNGSQALLMANPEIIWTDPEATFTYNEGCLSIPEQYADVTRPKAHSLDLPRSKRQNAGIGSRRSTEPMHST